MGKNLTKYILVLFIIGAVTLGIVFAQKVPLLKDVRTYFIGNNGSSFERAISIENISNYENCGSEDGLSEEYGKSITQEYDYLENKFGVRDKDWHLKMQSFEHHGSQLYDILEIELLPSLKTKKMYFEITEPFMAMHIKSEEMRGEK